MEVEDYNKQNNYVEPEEKHKPWGFSISTGCILYIICVISLFWFCIRSINKCTHVPETKVEYVHDTVYVDTNSSVIDYNKYNKQHDNVVSSKDKQEHNNIKR